MMLSTRNPTMGAWLKDMAERALSTFVQAFLAFLIVNQSITSATLYAALIAGALAVVKSIGIQVGGKTPLSSSDSVDKK